MRIDALIAVTPTCSPRSPGHVWMADSAITIIARQTLPSQLSRFGLSKTALSCYRK